MGVKFALALLILLGACRQAEAPAQKAPTPAPAPQAEGDVGAAQRLVRQRLGGAGEVRFADAQRRAAGGVEIICGVYEQAGVRQRYIVVGGDRAFVEPQMRPGEMERAYGEFCTDGERG
jgi:hypothetical protein